MKRNAISFIVGVVFALGLGVSGMTNPKKVIGFLDVLGTWDISLAFVMVGAILLHGSLFPFITKRSSPILDDQFHFPKRSDLHPTLLLGAAIFGVGWGLAGYCPGPGIVSSVSGQQNSLVFVVSMLIGMLVFHWVQPHLAKVFK